MVIHVLGFTDVLEVSAAHDSKYMESLRVLPMIQDGSVASCHLHIADLTFTGVPKGSIVPKAIGVAVLGTRLAGDQEHNWVFIGRADSTLSLPAVPIVKCLTTDHFAGDKPRHVKDIILRVLRDDAESQIVQEPTRLAGAYAAAEIGWVQSLSSGVFGSDADYGFRRIPVAVVKYIVVPGLAEIVLYSLAKGLDGLHNMLRPYCVGNGGHDAPVSGVAGLLRHGKCGIRGEGREAIV